MLATKAYGSSKPEMSDAQLRTPVTCCIGCRSVSFLGSPSVGIPRLLIHQNMYYIY